MLYLNLQPILTARGIKNPYTYLVQQGISYGVANKLMYSTSRGFKLDTIEKLCEILNCEVHDLLVWHPNAQQAVNPNHPLQPLRPTKNQAENPEISLFSLPYKKLKEISKNLNAEISQQPKEEI